MNPDSGDLESGELFDESFDFKEFTWKIPNWFSFPNEEDYKVDSRTFSFAGAFWKLRLFPFRRTEFKNEECIDLRIIRLHSRFTKHDVFWKFVLEDKDGNQFKRFPTYFSIFYSSLAERGVVYIMKNSALKDMKDNPAPNNTLNVVCQMRIKKVEVHERYSQTESATSLLNSSSAASSGDESSDEFRSNEEDKAKEVPSSNDKGLEILSNNLKQVFLDGRMTDTVLKADGKDFHVHKVILVARSPVFASMFQHDLAEKKTNEVDIPDCTADSFEAFLHYLYTVSVETLSTSNVYNVYYAADKYQVDDLKDKCVKFMMKNISVETICDVMDLSLRHGESELQKIAVDFFCQNNKEIVKTVQWLRYMEANTVQANELFIKVLKA